MTRSRSCGPKSPRPTSRCLLALLAPKELELPLPPADCCRCSPISCLTSCTHARSSASSSVRLSRSCACAARTARRLRRSTSSSRLSLATISRYLASFSAARSRSSLSLSCVASDPASSPSTSSAADAPRRAPPAGAEPRRAAPPKPLLPAATPAVAGLPWGIASRAPATALSRAALSADGLSRAFSFLSASIWRTRKSRSSSCDLSCALRRALSLARCRLTRSSRSASSRLQSSSLPSVRVRSIHSMLPSSFFERSTSSSICTSYSLARKARRRSFSCSCSTLDVFFCSVSIPSIT